MILRQDPKRARVEGSSVNAQASLTSLNASLTGVSLDFGDTDEGKRNQAFFDEHVKNLKEYEKACYKGIADKSQAQLLKLCKFQDVYINQRSSRRNRPSVNGKVMSTAGIYKSVQKVGCFLIHMM